MSNQPLTDDELAAIRARAEAACPFERGEYFDIEDCTIGDRHLYYLVGTLLDTAGLAEKDRVFIRNARTDIDTLLAEVERLRKMVADLQDEKLDLEDEIVFSEMDRIYEDD